MPRRESPSDVTPCFRIMTYRARTTPTAMRLTVGFTIIKHREQATDCAKGREQARDAEGGAVALKSQAGLELHQQIDDEVGDQEEHGKDGGDGVQVAEKQRAQDQPRAGHGRSSRLPVLPDVAAASHIG